MSTSKKTKITIVGKQKAAILALNLHSVAPKYFIRRPVQNPLHAPAIKKYMKAL